MRLTEAQFADYFRQALQEDMCGCSEMINEQLSPTDKSDIKAMIRKEIKDFLDVNRSSEFETKVADIIKKRFKSDKDFEKYFVDVTRNVLIQLYKNLYTRRNFWANDLKNASS